MTGPAVRPWIRTVARCRIAPCVLRILRDRQA